MAQTYGLGNFIYEIDIVDGKANFKFWDAADASNTAEVSIAKADFPDGAPADSRQVADLAYSECQKVLNDKRDTRLKQEAADELEAKQAEDKRVREEANDFLANSQDVEVAPAHIEKDGTRVYNTAKPSDNDNKKK